MISEGSADETNAVVSASSEQVLVCPVLVEVSNLSALWPRRLITAGGVCDQRGQGSRIMVLSLSLSTPTVSLGLISLATTAKLDTKK